MLDCKNKTSCLTVTEEHRTEIKGGCFVTRTEQHFACQAALLLMRPRLLTYVKGMQKIEHGVARARPCFTKESKAQTYLPGQYSAC